MFVMPSYRESSTQNAPTPSFRHLSWDSIVNGNVHRKKSIKIKQKDNKMVLLQSFNLQHSMRHLWLLSFLFLSFFFLLLLHLHLLRRRRRRLLLFLFLCNQLLWSFFFFFLTCCFMLFYVVMFLL